MDCSCSFDSTMKQHVILVACCEQDDFRFAQAIRLIEPSAVEEAFIGR